VKPAIAIISNSQTPYRLHLHRRIATELAEVQLWSVYTHETSNSTWQFQAPPEIGPVLFGKGESCEDQDKPIRMLREWRRGGRIIGWMKEHDIRFVVMMGYNDIGRMRMIRWCRRNRVPCFLFGDSNIHGDVTGGLKALVKKVVVGWVVRSCAGVLCCGTLGKAYFEKYGAKPDRIFFFPYEPDYELVENPPLEKIEEAKRRFVLPADRRRIVYSGRFVSIKRVDLLIDAFAAIADRRPNWDLILIGDGPLRQALMDRAPSSLKERIVWAGFIDDQALISAIYQQCDVLVLASDYEPWALVINEAAAAGLAIVASSVVGAAAELVRDGANGRVFPPGDMGRLTECLLDVTDPLRTDAMKSESAKVLAQWRERGDPVAGLCGALRDSGVIEVGQSLKIEN
jgi:glycosyltransferase involved in cell wall biosynthesis